MKFVLGRVVMAGCSCLVLVMCSSTGAADDVLARSRAMYAGLRSYADTGTVLHEFGVSSKERHTFTTDFNRAPRRFYFDFRKESGDRFVVFGDADAFHTWWKATGVQSDYPNPNNVGAFTLSAPTTLGAALKIPTLLYANAGLPGDFSNLRDMVADGTETLGGRRCDRLVGMAADFYGNTQREVNARKITMWIDAESLLLRKVVEEWTPLPGQVSRNTTTWEPQANPTIEDSRFRFTKP